MNLSIREHIINNFKGDNYDTLKRAIDESVASQDEVTLPGLGVFFRNHLGKCRSRIKKSISRYYQKKS